MDRDHWRTVGILALVFFVRAWRADQPIWEGYIGRQVPTAMVARNLMRDGDFLRPKLDTGPFPSYFLVEPPIYAGAAAVLARMGIPLETAGRVISAFGVALGAWGLFGLVSRRSDDETGRAAMILFGFLPVLLRYGRAFQPDALMIGLMLAGLRLSDGRGRMRTAAALALLALGVATKATGVYLLIVLLFLGDGRALRRWPLAATALLPAIAWYAWAFWLMRQGGTDVSTSAGNAANWSSRLLNVASWDVRSICRDWAYRSFTSIGTSLFLLGLTRFGELPRAVRAGLIGLAATLVVLAGKLHHEYYEILAAPWIAWIGARAVDRRDARRAILAGLVALSLLQSRSTWSTPAEWVGLSEAGGLARSSTAANERLIAPEALLYAADRRGCRLETQANAVERAAAEWGADPDAARTALELVDLYRSRAKASIFADLRTNDERTPLHDALRNRPGSHVVHDEPGGLLLIRFAEEGPAHVDPP